ncbi:MAG: alpha/beta hydrolase [Bacteroidota bacterium]
MRQLNRIALLFLASLLLIASSCKEPVVAPDDYGIFSSQDASTAIMNGELNSQSPQYWKNYLSAYPNTTNIIMKNCPGSSDDDSTLFVAKEVRKQQVAIHLPADAEIASGAVDFYLSGVVRTREAGSKIGVHSWGSGRREATDYPVGHENHQPYIDYYKEMGFSEEDAEAFYYFTINAAPASDIHWMTDAEIEQYKLLVE